MTKDYVAEEEKISGEFGGDPLVKLKQQEIDLRAAEAMARQQDMQTKTTMNAARLDMDRDKIEADTTIKLMETADRIDHSAAKNALGELKENVSLTKEALKNEKDVTKARITGGRKKARKKN